MSLVPGWNPNNAAQDALLMAAYRRARSEQIKAGKLDLPLLTSQAAIAGFVRSHAFRQPGVWYRSAEEAAACSDEMPGEWEPPKPPEPTLAPPGSWDRVAAYRARMERGEELFHEADAGHTG